MRRALSSRSKPAKGASGNVRKNVFVGTIVALLVVLALSFVPTPFYIIAPGNAVDLSSRLTLEGRPPANRHFYLTDVAVGQASVILLGAGLVPGVRLVRRDLVVPAGESARGFDRSMIDAMSESQAVAAVVAERAAGLAVPEPAQTLEVRDVLAASHAIGVVRAGDTLVAIDGVPLRTYADLRRALRRMRAPAAVVLSYSRAGHTSRTRLATIASPLGGARLGVALRVRVAAPDLPVPVRYAMGNVAGSSGGLMFALQIFEDLHPGTRRDPVAGTGTLALDGTVGPIEGVQQKVIAAERAGIRTFLVPRENYAAVARDATMRIIPVHTFAAALAASRS